MLVLHGWLCGGEGRLLLLKKRMGQRWNRDFDWGRWTFLHLEEERVMGSSFDRDREWGWSGWGSRGSRIVHLGNCLVGGGEDRSGVDQGGWWFELEEYGKEVENGNWRLCVDLDERV